MLPSFKNSGRSQILFTLTGIIVILIGGFTIICWFLNIEGLKSTFPGFAIMKFNTALCIIISGTSFLLLTKNNNLFSKNLFRILVIILGCFTLVTLSEYIFHWSAGIDQLFFNDHNPGLNGQIYPGRMSPSTALCFVLLAISLLGIKSEHLAYKNIAQYLLHGITLIVFISLIGYLFKVPYSLKFSFFSTMALNTAVAFSLLSTVASSINYNLGFTGIFTGKEIGSIVARKLFPGMILVLIVLGYISIELQRINYITPEFGIILSTISFLLIGLFLIKGTLTELNHLDLKRAEAENETKLLNRNLEDIVLKRTIDLKHSNERFIKIFNSNPTGLAISKLDTGSYAEVNPAFLEMMDYNLDEIIGHTSSELEIISTDYRKQMVDILNKYGFIKNVDIKLKDKHNTFKHCILSAELFEDEHQKYMMSFVYDITDRKIIENNLLAAKKELEFLADKLTNQNGQLLSFAHIISHNLRAPVSNLNLLANFYKESTTQEDKDELWGNFETVIGHLNTTLDELLETLKIQEDTARDREELSFEKTFNTIKEILVGQLIETKAIIKTDFSKAPDVFYPKIYLESIMLNLISNAIKYKSPDRPPLLIIASDNADGEVSLTVKDNGLGIDMARHSKNLFGLRKTFHRHAEAKGVGLFLTKTQVETMGGEISAESVVNEGTTFKVIFNKKQP
jgi:PAS domain S-box-containing protein